MRQPDSRSLRWLLVTGFLAATAATMVSPVSAQSVRVQAPAAGGGIPSPAPPSAAPSAEPGHTANAVPAAGPADTTVPPTHRETLDDCMGDWDTQTHMSKSEWREACRRTLNGTEMGGLDLLGLENAANGGQKKHSRR
jgi:hypothetical protein